MMIFFLLIRSASRPPNRLAGMHRKDQTIISRAMFPALRPIFLSRSRVIMGQTMDPMLVTMFPKNST